MEPNSFVGLDAHAWPFGAALIRLALEPVSPTATRMWMAETLSPEIGRLHPDAHAVGDAARAQLGSTTPAG
jgi:hypothetical protein